MAARTPRAAVISARTGQGVPALLEAVAADLAEPTADETLHLGFDQGRERAWLFDRKLVRAERRTEDGFDLHVRWDGILRDARARTSLWLDVKNVLDARYYNVSSAFDHLPGVPQDPVRVMIGIDTEL